MAKKGEVKAKILVCHGGADKFVTQADIDSFKKNLDEADATYTFKVYPGATHAFTNPASTEVGKKFNMIDSVKSQQDFLDAASYFDRIAISEKTQWLPFYYSAYCRTIAAFMK